MNSRNYIGCVLAVLLVAAHSMTNAAVGSFLNGSGANSRALAGAGAAFADDGMSMAINPANLVSLEGAEWQFGATFLTSQQYVDASEVDGSLVPPGGLVIAPGKRKAEPDVPAEVNGVFPIPFGAIYRRLDENNALGLVIYGNGGININYKSFANDQCPPGTPGQGYLCFGTTGSDISQFFIAPTWAHRVNDSLQIGISPALIFQTLEISGFQIFSQASSRPEKLSNKGHSNVFGGALKLGMSVKIRENLRLGLGAQSRGYMAEHDEYSGLLPEHGDLDVPPYFQVGLSWKITPSVTLLSDFQRIYFSEVKAFANPSASPELYGDENGPGFGWRDASIVKLGLHVNLDERLTARFGFADVTRLPILKEEILANMVSLGIFDTQLAAGLTWKWDKRNALDIAVHSSLRQTIHGVNPGVPEQKLKMANEVFTLDIGWRKQF